MLQEVYIQNYALIDEISLELKDNFSCITGETGAGKSILLGALGLILGNRVDHSKVKNREKKCLIEAHFDIKAYQLERVFQENDLVYENPCIIRREISPNGKTRQFINDSPVLLEQLKMVGEELIDVHSQNQSRFINNASFQYRILDSFANNALNLEAYQLNFQSYKKLKKQVFQLKEEVKNSAKEEDYISFQIEELNQLCLNPGELKKLEEEYKLLNNSEHILKLYSAITEGFNHEESGVLNQLNHLKNQAINLEKIDETWSTWNERLSSAEIELEDLMQELSIKAEMFTVEPGRLQQVEERLNSINRMLLKHHCSREEELLEQLNSFEKRLAEIQNNDNNLDKAEFELKQIKEVLTKESDALFKARAKVIPEIQQEISLNLSQLNMPDAQVLVNLNPGQEFNEFGQSTIELLFTANKGVAPSLVEKSASGGEISRLMLALKELMARHLNLPSVIFDEIDTGVSGKVATQMADLMLKMAKKRQVISISHLPQVAAKCQHHYLVYKEKGEEETRSNIKLIEGEDRIKHLAEMLSNGSITDASVNNARELIELNEN